MTVQIIYQKILDLQLWHDYYLGQPNPPKLPDNYDIADLLTLVPTSDCLRTLKNLRWVYRPHNAGGQIFAKVKPMTADDFATEFPLNESYQLNFWLMVRNPYFVNFTNLPLTTVPNSIYYFSNLSNNKDHNLFLTRPLLIYKPTTEYLIGQLVTHQGKTLEALTYKASATSEPDPKDWETIEPSSQYVSALDRLTWQSSTRTQIIPSINPGETFSIKLVDINQRETFVFQGKASPGHPPGTPLTVNFNFGEQQPGWYQLTLNDTKVDEFVLRDPIAAQNAWGLVEIVLNPNLVSSEFALLEQSGQQTLIRPKTYVIRWKNRATSWRYYYEKFSGFEPKNFPNFDQFFELDTSQEQTYATKRPLGLFLQPPRFPPKEQPPQEEDPPLPAPGVALIEPKTDANKHIIKIFSDIHL